MRCCVSTCTGRFAACAAILERLAYVLQRENERRAAAVQAALVKLVKLVEIFRRLVEYRPGGGPA